VSLKRSRVVVTLVLATSCSSASVLCHRWWALVSVYSHCNLHTLIFPPVNDVEDSVGQKYIAIWNPLNVFFSRKNYFEIFPGPPLKRNTHTLLSSSACKKNGPVNQTQVCSNSGVLTTSLTCVWFTGGGGGQEQNKNLQP
jgi:hypothetical protein